MHGRRVRVATKYMNLTRRFFSQKGVTGYRIVESLGATEGAPAALLAELIVDITTTGATLRANGLKVLDDGVSSSRRPTSSPPTPPPGPPSCAAWRARWWQSWRCDMTRITLRQRHPREGGDPRNHPSALGSRSWIPASGNDVDALWRARPRQSTMG